VWARRAPGQFSKEDQEMEQHATPTEADAPALGDLDVIEARYGTRFLYQEAPAERLPRFGMPALDAMRLVGEELIIDGSPMRNLATFVTTWMEPEAQRLIAENLHRNFIDHAEYPRTAEIEQRCIRMLAHRFTLRQRRQARGRKGHLKRSCLVLCR
jgi:hypothetical protein